jgi:hypothetical protein
MMRTLLGMRLLTEPGFVPGSERKDKKKVQSELMAILDSFRFLK